MKKTCCFTGHRELPKEKIPELRELLFKEIITLAANDGITHFAYGVSVAGLA